MDKKFTQLITKDNITYQIIFEFDKQGKKVELDKQIIDYKTPKPNRLNGKTSKKNNYTPSPITISINSKISIYKNINSQPKKNKEAFISLIKYIADLHDTKNDNKEKIDLIYNNREIIEIAATKEEKQKLIQKIYNNFLDDANTKKFSKTISRHSVFSLPPNLEIPRHQQAKILQETMIKTIDEMEEFKDHKYLIAIHEDQINSNGGVHCHIIMAHHNGKGHSLRAETITALKQRNNEFKRKMVDNLKEHGIELENHQKPLFTPDLYKELTFLEITKNHKVLVVDKIGEIRELKFKGCVEEAKKHNLKIGDRFDYIVEETNEPKLYKNGQPIIIKDKKQFKKQYLFDNIKR